MIKSFADKRTEVAFSGTFDKGFPQDIQKRARRKLEMLNAATVLDDLRNPPGNRLHALTGDFAGFYAISINDQWRVIFRWNGQDATDVEILDYH